MRVKQVPAGFRWWARESWSEPLRKPPGRRSLQSSAAVGLGAVLIPVEILPFHLPHGPTIYLLSYLLCKFG